MPKKAFFCVAIDTILTATTLFMKKYLFYLLPLICIILFSCQKEITDPNPQTETGENGNPDTGTYLPLTKDTYWKYKDSASGAFTTLQVLDIKKVINGRTYTAVLGTDPMQTDTFYMTQQNRDYYNYAAVDNGTSSGTFLFHYLNDTAAVGRSWEYQAGQGNGVPAFFKTTIVERNLTRTVNNATYYDVIHTRMELSYDMSGQRTPAGSYEYYIAKDVGIIQVKTSIGLFGFEMIASSDLVEYEIK
jgi:hypothetical protein